MKANKSHRFRRIFFRVLAVLGLLLILLISLSALSNLVLPSHSEVIDHLSQVEKARVAEAIHLRQSLGDNVWPGWGQADIPMIVYNEEYAFLLGYKDPPAGWVKVPQDIKRGGPWEPVPADTFNGETYYRQKLPGDGVIPESFAVLVGSRWVSSMATKEAAIIRIGDQIKGDLPGPLAVVFPYRLFGRMAMGNSDQYIALLLHESFHAYQGVTAGTRLADSENANRAQGNNYPWDDGALQSDWQKELNMLADSARTTSDAQARELARRFLDTRKERRSTGTLSSQLQGFERQREWLEGLAKYTELTIWRQAAETPSYTPSAVVGSDSDFKRYTTASERWSQEVDQATRMASDEGDGRFYYSGMLQATLLDRLMPDWKSRILITNTWLEDLLREAVE